MTTFQAPSMLLMVCAMSLLEHQKWLGGCRFLSAWEEAATMMGCSLLDGLIEHWHGPPTLPSVVMEPCLGMA